MKLLFLSNTRVNTNSEVIGLLKSWINDNSKIGYIPSSSDPTRKYFKEADGWLREILEKDVGIDYLEIHDGKKWEYESVSDYECFFISGGNTYHLLDGLRRSGVGAIIERVAKETDRGIIGVSAGGIVLTPDIRSAIAENDLGITAHGGLGLVNFGFYPHFKKEDKTHIREIDSFFDKTNIDKTYALPEYSGLAYINGLLQPLGEVFVVHRQKREIEKLSNTTKYEGA